MRTSLSQMLKACANIGTMKQEELIKLEHNTLLEEYRAIRQDILFNVGTYRQAVTLTLSAAGILVASAPYIIQSNLPIIFLIAPLIFYVLAWIQMRYLIVYYNLSEYLDNILVPRIRRILARSKSKRSGDFDSIMSWETYFGRIDRRYMLLFLPTVAGSYSINLLACVLSLGAYFAHIIQTSQPIQWIDVIAIVTNLLLLAYTVFLGLWAGRFRVRSKQSGK